MDPGVKWPSRFGPGILQTSKILNTITFVVLVVLAASASMAQESCDVNRVDVRWQGGKARFTVEVADDFDERAQGLMFRTEMARYSGMLFVYPEPSKVSFWMKNTLIPLDMIFLGQGGRVVKIHENATPQDLTPIPGGDNIFAVLEINGGMVRKLGIREGAEMRHPAFPLERAVWPCE